MSRSCRMLAVGGAVVAALLPAAGAWAHAAPAGTPGPACAIDYTWQQASATRYTAAIQIDNTGTTVINGWTLGFVLTDPQRVLTARDARFDTVTGSIVAHNTWTNAVVGPGGSVTVGYVGAGTATAPPAFTVNGVVCAVGS